MSASLLASSVVCDLDLLVEVLDGRAVEVEHTRRPAPLQVGQTAMLPCLQLQDLPIWYRMTFTSWRREHTGKLLLKRTVPVSDGRQLPFPLGVECVGDL